tara:strand:- start:200 stop:547 length:348 start_codon:yes stop_codon:yes gene_type:complete
MISTIQFSQMVLTQASGGAPASPLGGVLQFVPLALIILVMYFLLIRPANKQRQEHQKLLNALKKDDKVVTNGGICGKVVSVDNNVATLEIADKVKVRILKDRISGLWDAEAKATK